MGPLNPRVGAASLLALAAALMITAATGAIAPVSARQQASTGDAVELLDLTAGRPAPGSPAGAIRFEAQLSYRLESAPKGFLLLLIFENDEDTSNQQTSDPIPIAGGSGQLSLDLEYEPGPDVRTLSLFAALLAEEEDLLSFVSTTPISLAPWPGRSAFDQALEARMAGDYGAAAEHLSRAIQLSPETGSYYYWRADTWIRLGRHEAATLDYTRALELMPQDRASRVGRGISFLWQSQWEAALEDLTFAIDHSPTPDRWAAWAHRARGITYSRLDRSTEAIADYRAYLALTPNASDRAEVDSWIAALR